MVEHLPIAELAARLFVHPHTIWKWSYQATSSSDVRLAVQRRLEGAYVSRRAWTEFVRQVRQLGALTRRQMALFQAVRRDPFEERISVWSDGSNGSGPASVEVGGT